MASDQQCPACGGSGDQVKRMKNGKGTETVPCPRCKGSGIV